MSDVVSIAKSAGIDLSDRDLPPLRNPGELRKPRPRHKPRPRQQPVAASPPKAPTPVATYKKRRKRSVVYFIRRGGPDGPIKIGRTEDIAKRLASLQCACAEPLTVLATVPGGAAEEFLMHEMLVNSRLMGEWFRPTVEVLQVVAEYAAAAAEASR